LDRRASSWPIATVPKSSGTAVDGNGVVVGTVDRGRIVNEPGATTGMAPDAPWCQGLSFEVVAPSLRSAFNERGQAADFMTQTGHTRELYCAFDNC
jgi:hypothetical protein